MSWNSWSDFWAMGGYAPYVWGSMGVVCAVIAGEVLGLVWQRRAVIAEVVQLRRARQDERRRGTPTSRKNSQ